MNVVQYFPKIYKKFCEFTQDYALQHEKKITVRPVGFLRLYGGKCIGYCEEDGNVTIASKHKLSAPTYIHEFSHMNQQVEDIPLWHHEGVESYLAPNIEKIYHLCKKGVKDFKAFYDTMLLERDCEKRSIKYIEEFNIPLDIELYAKRANLYLYYYQFLFLKRKWGGSNSIYKPELMKEMPSEIVPPRKLRNIDMDLMEKFDRILSK